MKGDGRCLKLLLAFSILFQQNVNGGEVGHNHSLRDAKVTMRCIERERQALLAFKRVLVDGFNYLSSWGSEAQKQDCCRWEGVYCSNQTGHVIQLGLADLQGKMISPKLIELQHLQYLDLEFIDFNGSQIPDFIGSLTNLRYLSLSSCNLVGQIPSSFGNLTQLQHLDLGYNQLQAENLNWLPALSSLTYLDLSGANLSTLDFALINFNGSQIPVFIGSLTNLRYLSLSSCNLVGQIPDFIGSLTNLRNLSLSSCNLVGQIPSSFRNLTQLQNLDLSYNQLQAENLNWLGNLTQLQNLDLAYNQLQAENLNWLPALSSLTDLDLSGNNLSTVFDWPEAVLNKLPKLVDLHLMSCSLPPPPTPILSITLSKTNSSTSLAHVSLRNNHLTSPIFLWLSNYSTSLFTLGLSNNNLTDLIPDFNGNMSSLEYLDLSDNQIEGANPNSFARLCNLRTLQLQTNHLSGQLSKFVQLLPRCAQNSLEELYLSENVLAGSLNNLTSFSSLQFLDLHANQLSGKIPESIGQMSQLQYIDFSINSLKGVVSETHFSKLSKLIFLDLSSNSLVLNFHSDWVPPFQLDYINLASCKVGPVFPKWLQTQKHTSKLDISNAGISDILPSWFWSNFHNADVINLSQNLIRGIFTNLTVEFTYNLELHLSSNQIEGPFPSTLSQASYLDLSNNKISGSLSFLCESAYMNLAFLNLSSNNFYGDLPDCGSQLAALVMLDLSYNAFSGKIPVTIGSLWQIATLKLRSNRFIGELPSSLKNCTRLQVIDLGDNELSGSIPKWLGVSLKNLVILMLSSNHFNGSMPSQLCHLTRIQILDFSVNNISGSIPKCLNNLTTLAQKGNPSLSSIHIYDRSDKTTAPTIYEDDASFIWKGRMQTYKATLRLVKRIDLSSNRLTGEIPSQITPEIGNLESLDSLDLSRNQIDGRIPTSLARIDRLSFLDLSYNNLSGKIPTGTQLQSFDPLDYAKNPELCGPPLKKMCADQNEQTDLSNEEDKDEFITLGFYISLGIGFATGFWGVCGTLIFNRPWR
ncbi:receptor-like protein 12 [Prunus avium]|uniref:Receptor-like protein 12 n=1 Tax=Prunus avium TaxID=42229 RepID=A0A6P5U4A8_PRUAV|nr:receptor-like protein 12 [Prunus avium]